MRFHPLSRRPRPQRGWVPGNKVDLLENGEAFYPAVFEAIRQARHEVIIETFILFEDKVGLALRDVLVEVARRGVRVDVLIDDWGSPDLSDNFVRSLADAGVRLRAFDPAKRWFGFRLHIFRRMHRKIVTVDGRVALVGGINFSADHLLDFGPEAKQDYAVRLEGPVAERIRRFAREQIAAPARGPRRDELRELEAPAPAAGPASVMFVWRDNREHRDDIERQYRAAIRSARRDVVIANAYFFPGYRVLKTLRQAARRGVRVRLILQGQPDMPIVKTATELLHARLLHAGVEIHEYCRRPLHGKVAVIDDDWSTVGSSNLDPLSLSLNLEANVLIRDSGFNAVLRERLEHLMAHHCRVVKPDAARTRGGWQTVLDTLAYHFTRHFPAWAGWLPAHTPRMTDVAVAERARVAERADQGTGAPPADAPRPEEPPALHRAWEPPR